MGKSISTILRKSLSLLLIAVAFGSFVAIFAIYHNRYGNAVAALAIIPISVGSWYLGTRGGIFTSILSILSYLSIQIQSGQTPAEISNEPSTFIGAFALLFVGLTLGRLADVTQEKHNAVIDLAHSNDLIYTLLQVTAQIENVPSPQEITKSLSDGLRQFGIAHAIALYDRQAHVFSFQAASITDEYLKILETRAGTSFTNRSFTLEQLGIRANESSHLRPRVVGDPQVELRALFNDHEMGDIHDFMTKAGMDRKTFVMRLPLMLEENLLGILWVWGNGILISDLPVMSIFAKQIGISLERARLFQEVQDLALTDPLTSLHNRRSIFELGRIEFSRADRFNRSFCCLMLDLDYFKQINDTFGHQSGDLVLQEFARHYKNSVRNVDLVGRYGGEELIILMPETELETAIRVAERLRLTTSDKKITLRGEPINVTVSIGVAAKDENTTELETLIARADQAMYIAKHKGRNRVAVSK